MKTFKTKFLLLLIIFIFSISTTSQKSHAFTKLSMGSTGWDVIIVQKMLNITINSSIAEDGKFGSGTRTAVRKFQNRHNLPVDGVVGNNTWIKLSSEYTKSIFNTNKAYRIKSIRWGYIDIPADAYNENGTQLQIWELAPGNINQIFRLAMEGNYLKIIAMNGKTVEVRDGSMNAGESVAVWDDIQGNMTKRWYLLPNPVNNGFLIVNANSGMLINVSGGAFQNGTKLWQYPLDGTDACAFYLEEISDSEYQALGKEKPSLASDPNTFDVLQQHNVNMKYSSSTVYNSGCAPCAMYNTFNWYHRPESLESIVKLVTPAYIAGKGTNNDKMLSILDKKGYITLHRTTESGEELLTFLQNNDNSAAIFGLSSSFLKTGKPSKGSFHVVSAVATDGNGNVFILDSSTSSCMFASKDKNKGYWISIDTLMKDKPKIRLFTVNK